MNIGLDQAQFFNAAAFVLHNKVVNENGRLIEFDQHRFLAGPYMDDSPRQVVRKCSQVGWSTLAIIRSIHLAKFNFANVIYTLPSKSAVKDFVRPKVDPLIQANPIIRNMIGKTESTALKSIGDRFIYFRGSWEESAAISISADILVEDEVDRSNQNVLRTYRTRLDAAKMARPDLGWEWKFSNPSWPGNGVDEWWEKSDQKHWMIKCPHCNVRQYLDWPNNIDIKRGIYICYKCQKELTPEDRSYGTWVKRRLGSDISGYWISQLMAPWISAKKIIEESQEDKAVFHNFTLGKPYITKDQTVTRESLAGCIVPDFNPQTDVAIGVDVGNTKHYVVGNRYGIFHVGTVRDWEEVENLRNRFGAVMVIDAQPENTPVRKLVEKYRGKVFMCHYKEDTKNLGIVQWGDGDKNGIVYADRTKIMDTVVSEINQKEIGFNMNLTDLENVEYIKHWLNMYRAIEENSKGMKKPIWLKQEGKDDHFAHATAYWRIAMMKTLHRGEVVRSPVKTSEAKHPEVSPTGTTPGLDLKDVTNRMQRRGSSWKTN